MSDNNCGCSGTVFLAFIMGAAIGGGIALLTAPRSGRETREKICDMTDEVTEKVKEITAEARDKVKEVSADAEARIKETIAEGKEILRERGNQIKSAIDAGKDALAAERAKHKGPEPA